MHRVLALMVYVKRRIFKDVVIWYGNYSSWKEALKHCTGYDHPRILEKVKKASLKVKNGDAAYERDSVIFMRPRPSNRLFKEITELEQKLETELHVLDFGGSLGSAYYQNKNMFLTNPKRTWSIVEQQHFVDAGKANFEDETLKFYYTIEECLQHHAVNLILCAGVLQCLEEPYKWLKKIADVGVKYIVINRIGIIDQKKDLLTIQYVPESIIESSYPCWFFVKADLISFLDRNGYRLRTEWYDIISKPIFVEAKLSTWQNLIFEKYE